MVNERNELVAAIQAARAAARLGAPREEIDALVRAVQEIAERTRRPRLVPRAANARNAVCSHRGGAIEQTVKVAGKGCGGKPRDVFHRAYKCDLFGRCLPHFRGPWAEPQREFEAKVFTLCRHCPSNDAQPPGAAGP